MKHSRFLIFFIFVLFTFFPFFADASEFRLHSNKADIRTEEEFTIGVFVSVDEKVNAIEGDIIFPDAMLELQRIEDGNSSLNFWIEKPRLDQTGHIVFSGITPGGFDGPNNNLFTLVFKAKKEGLASISTEKVKALKNDGEGTELLFSFRDAMVNIKSGDSNIRKEITKDETMPEPFTPEIAQDPLVYDGKWFIIFSTQDKGSGISHYEMKEYKFQTFSFLSFWKKMESPQVLSDQKLKSHILIRAVDNAGNQRIVEVAPSTPSPWYEYIFYWVIIACTMWVACSALARKWKKNI